MNKKKTMERVGYDTLMKEARALIDPEGLDQNDPESVEYVRGICELIASVSPKPKMFTADHAMEIARKLGLSSIVLYP